MNDSEIYTTRSSKFSKEDNRYAFFLRIASSEIYWAILTTGLVVIYAAVLIWRFYSEGFPGQQDDPYINYAYIDNFLRGNGLVFNQNEYVWGFTSPLQLLMLLAAALAGLNIQQFADIVGIFWLTIWSVLLFQLFRTILPPVISSAITLLMIFGWQDWSVVALESNLLVTCQLIFLLVITQKRPFWAGIFAAMACLARPDSLLLVVPLLLIYRETRKFSAMAAFAIPGLLWLGFSWLYYDAIVPQSFHAKSGMTAPSDYFERYVYYILNFSYLEDWSMSSVQESTLTAIKDHSSRAFISMTLVSLTLCNFFNRSFRNNRALVYLVFFPWILLLAYSIIGSHPSQFWHLFSARFFFRLTLFTAMGFGVLCIWRYLVSVGLRNQDFAWQTLRWGCIGIVAVVLSSMLYIQATSNKLGLEKSRHDFQANGGVRYEVYKQISHWINRNVERGSSIAMIEIGIIGYFTDVHIVDHEGIVTIGTRSGAEVLGFGGIVDAFHVDYLLLNGSETIFRSDEGMEYLRVKYFPGEGHFSKSLLKRVEKRDN